LAYYVKPSGRVFSYEVRPEFTERARRNLERAGLLEYVELKSGDVTVKIDERDVDAVVFDLATPWMGVRNVYEALRGGGGFASFSPTVEQVVKTVETLRDCGFVCVETVECMLRRIKVKAGETRPETLMVGHTGYLSFARKALR
jgi:tRNA (adenine57-N1/adenine58-N1)-methyltransferase